MFSDKKLNYSSKQKPSDSMVLRHFSARFIIARRYQSLLFDAKNSVRPLPQLQCFRNFFHKRNGPWIETYGNLKAQDQGCMLDVVAVRFLRIPEFLSWLFMQDGVSHQARIQRGCQEARAPPVRSYNNYENQWSRALEHLAVIFHCLVTILCCFL